MQSKYERFMAFVIKTDNCWTWSGRLRNGRYGGWKWDGAEVLAHRASWMLHYGPIPDGMSVCHRCDNPVCVNPAHLFLGSHTDNMRDMIAKGRRKFGDMPKGENHHGAKMAPDVVLDARRRWCAGASVLDLAREAGVCESTMREALSGKTWGHL